MSWDLATARAAAGIAAGDTTHDTALQRVMDVVLASVENLLGRGLLLRRETVRFLNPNTRRLRLPRYPILQVYTIDGKPYTGQIQHRVGWIEFVGSAGGRAVSVDYEGGFDPLPADLEAALWEAFVHRWSDVDPLTGLPTQGSGATVVKGSGDVSRITLADFGSVTYDVGSSVAGGDDGQGSLASMQARWGWLAPWATTLELYRSESAASLAFA